MVIVTNKERTMKLLTIDRGPHGHVGALMPNGDVLDIAALALVDPFARLVPQTLRSVLEVGADALDLVARCIERAGRLSRDETRAKLIVRPFAETSLLAPIPEPRLILSVGTNYGKHLREMGGTPPPPVPTAFIKPMSSLTGSGKPILIPPQCPDMIDYEGEFTYVFGKVCHNVSEAEAMDYLAGYTICNDVSARNWIPEFGAAQSKHEAIRSWERNIMGKLLPTFTPCGPVIVTKDEIKDPHDLQLTTTLNGQVMQSTKTDDLIHKLPAQISYFSKWYRLSPGDMVTTGSPSGVGFGRNPKVFMKAGDTIEVEIEGIGKLSNTLAARA
jgi:2-keto-4-pentenoate hydratase/2-oxohepta-3-ene-1,7-dioic acid hydratase in catechol pathway